MMNGIKNKYYSTSYLPYGGDNVVLILNFN